MENLSNNEKEELISGNNAFGYSLIHTEKSLGGSREDRRNEFLKTTPW